MKSRLFYVIGGSGSGKDSLMCYARKRLSNNPNVAFAHRYITRPANICGENHIALSHEEFEARRTIGLFSMHWQSHCHSYGIGIEIDYWLSKGMNVVVNGSREYLNNARQKYSGLLPVHIVVSSDALRARLLARGRENHAEVDARIDRHLQFIGQLPGDCIEIKNNDSLADAGEQFIRAILKKSRRKTCA
jgi:ribose 1,5-bisphosphokinase